jgi:iron(III) transport system substrate-binding protein
MTDEESPDRQPTTGDDATGRTATRTGDTTGGPTTNRDTGRPTRTTDDEPRHRPTDDDTTEPRTMTDDSTGPRTTTDDDTTEPRTMTDDTTDRREAHRRTTERAATTTGVGRSDRRRFLAASGLVGAASLSGCLSGLLGTDTPTGAVSMTEFRGSGPLVESRPAIDAPSIADLPDLSGSLTIYLGTGEGGRYETLLKLFRRYYDGDVEPMTRPGKAASQANSINEEMQGGGSSEADVFWSVDAGSLAAVAAAGNTDQLPKDVVSDVPRNFRPGRKWVGTAGRARAIAYNTNELTADEVPGKVAGFPGNDRFRDAMAWAPSYPAFVSFVTAMRLQRGREQTKQWLNGMQQLGVTEYPTETLVSNAVADGNAAAGFANHYYAMRVRSGRPNAPIDLAFTSGDAGALVNTAGVAVVEGTDEGQLARRFVQHLLSAEAQEFFATRAFSYPMVSGVPPVGGLPSIEELDPPDLSLQKLSNVDPTLDLLRETGVIS